MGKLKVTQAFLHTTKTAATRDAKKLRRNGFRAEVAQSMKTTQKRSPSLKWVVWKGQKKK